MLHQHQLALEQIAGDAARPLEHRLYALQALWDFGAINQENLPTYCRDHFALDHLDIVGMISPDGKHLYCGFRLGPLL